MKKVITPKQSEEAKYYCDKHHDRECFNEIHTNSWYGSKFDLQSVDVHLCDECMSLFYSYCKEYCGIKPNEITLD